MYFLWGQSQHGNQIRLCRDRNSVATRGLGTFCTHVEEGLVPLCLSWLDRPSACPPYPGCKEGQVFSATSPCPQQGQFCVVPRAWGHFPRQVLSALSLLLFLPWLPDIPSLLLFMMNTSLLAHTITITSAWSPDLNPRFFPYMSMNEFTLVFVLRLTQITCSMTNLWYSFSFPQTLHNDKEDKSQ